jgi:CRP-like cAMP-binding protein
MEPLQIEKAWEGTADCLMCVIRKQVLFADLDKSDFELIHHPIDERSLDSGKTLYREGDKPDYIYTVRAGLVKLVRYLEDGSFRVVRLLRQGDVIGLEAIDNKPYLHHAITVRATSVCQIPVEVIENINNHSPHLHRQLNHQWQRAISDADLWLAKFTSGFARQRVANLLLYLTNNGTFEKCLLLSREDMGAILSLTTETVSRIISEFKRENLIELLPEHCARVNLEELRRLI